jgi:hypothetical protein
MPVFCLRPPDPFFPKDCDDPSNNPSCSLDAGPLAGAHLSSNSDLLDFIERDLIVRAVVELGGAGTLVRSHRLCVFERATAVQVGCDPGCPESMVANLCWDADVCRAALNHAPGVGLGHAAPGESLGAPDGGAEEGLFVLAGEARALNIVLKIAFKMSHRVPVAETMVGSFNPCSGPI